MTKCTRIIPEPIVHDHFDGSANCIECRGRCRLTGADRALTEMVRWEAQRWITQRTGPNMMMKATLETLGLDVDRLMATAAERENATTHRVQVAEEKP